MSGILGLDLGEKRVGVAFAELETCVATPLETLQVGSKAELVKVLRNLIEEYRVTIVIVGLPKNLKGEIAISAQDVMRRVDFFKKEIEQVEWLLWDERLTTQEVERVLLEADVSRSARKDVRDKLAAQRILQSYLDAQKNKG